MNNKVGSRDILDEIAKLRNSLEIKFDTVIKKIKNIDDRVSRLDLGNGFARTYKNLSLPQVGWKGEEYNPLTLPESGRSGRKKNVKVESSHTTPGGQKIPLPDQLSGFETTGQIYSIGEDIYNCMLHLSNISRNLSKYYHIQIIKTIGKEEFHMFSHWGRVGIQGQHAIKKFRTEKDCVLEFCKKFFLKTGNNWDNRSNFEEKTRKYTMIDISDDNDEGQALFSNQNTKNTTNNEVSYSFDPQSRFAENSEVSLTGAFERFHEEVQNQSNETNVFSRKNNGWDDFGVNNIGGVSQTIQSKERRFKVCLLGSGNVGKTYFMKRLCGQSKVKEESVYNPTIGVEVFDMTFYCNDGNTYILNFWDTAGQERYGGLRDGYYIMSNAGIFFWDKTEKSSLTGMDSFIRDYVRVCGTTNCFAIVTTSLEKDRKDEKEEQFNPESELENVIDKWSKPLKHRIPSFEVDLEGEQDQRIYDPILCVLRKLSGNDNLLFTKTKDY